MLHSLERAGILRAALFHETILDFPRIKNNCLSINEKLDLANYLAFCFPGIKKIEQLQLSLRNRKKTLDNMPVRDEKGKILPDLDLPPDHLSYQELQQELEILEAAEEDAAIARARWIARQKQTESALADLSTHLQNSNSAGANKQSNVTHAPIRNEAETGFGWPLHLGILIVIIIMIGIMAQNHTGQTISQPPSYFDQIWAQDPTRQENSIQPNSPSGSQISPPISNNRPISNSKSLQPANSNALHSNSAANNNSRDDNNDNADNIPIVKGLHVPIKLVNANPDYYYERNPPTISLNVTVPYENYDISKIYCIVDVKGLEPGIRDAPISLFPNDVHICDSDKSYRCSMIVHSQEEYDR